MDAQSLHAMALQTKFRELCSSKINLSDTYLLAFNNEAGKQHMEV